MAKTPLNLTANQQPPAYILPLIVGAQFTGTSLWFAGNAVLPSLQALLGLGDNAIGDVTSAVQIGFILGCLCFALLSIADRYSPSVVFFGCSVLGALANLVIVVFPDFSYYGLLFTRFITGFFLAGIYPVGMKIASDWYKEGLGTALGYLVGALVIGTAFPHLVSQITNELPWRYVLIITSAAALLGGLTILLFVGNGPYHDFMQKRDFTAFLGVFKIPKFRAAAFAYFGHMWELYAVWAFVPFILVANTDFNGTMAAQTPLFAFLIIGIGGPACVMGGYLSQRWGNARVGALALAISGLCCVFSPLAIGANIWVLMIFMFIWGASVIVDSPQFSTLVAQNAPDKNRATALTIVNSIGFTLTIISIQGINYAQHLLPDRMLFLLLAPGPILGLWNLRRLLAKSR